MENNSGKGLRVIEEIDEKTCKELGILVLDQKRNKVSIGAMNPGLKTLGRLIEKLETQLDVKVELSQITTDEWERWIKDEKMIKNTELIDENSIISRERTGSRIREDSEIISDSKEGLTKAELGTEIIFDEEIVGSSEEANREKKAITGEVSGAELWEFGSKENEDQEPTPEEESGEIALKSDDENVRAVAEILLKSDALKASDIHIEPQEDVLRVRYRVDGLLKTEFKFDKNRINTITARCKVIAKLDVAEKRLPQDGRLRVNFGTIVLDFRVSTLPGKFGEKIVMRALRSDDSILNLQKLISEERELKTVRELCDNPYGIFIVVGPTGSGKSTTLYSILSEQNDPEINISTVEDPIEYTLPGLHQVQVVREKGFDFARALRALMRQDPDVILVGETRDKETAQVAMEAALTGHMVFTTLHANDTATAITRLAEMDVPPYLVASTVVGILSQRLVRKVCSSCSSVEASDMDNELLKRHEINKHRVAKMINPVLHIKDELKCQECDGTGYKGRIGVYEVLNVDDSIKHLILQNKQSDEIRAESRRRGLRTLMEYGMELVRKELTTLEEVERVCMLEKAEDI